jgi:ribosomal protein L4
MSAAMVSAGDMGVAATPTAAAASEAGMSTSVSATMATAMSTSVSTAMAAATSAGGRKRWGKGDGSAERCGRDDSDHTLSRHGGVILSGYPIHQA